jgi:hypothetical protein
MGRVLPPATARPMPTPASRKFDENRAARLVPAEIHGSPLRNQAAEESLDARVWA